MKPKIDKPSRDRDAICGKCAQKMGGTPPEGHRGVTFWNGKCDYCGKPSGCCSIGDYDWPAADFSDRRD